MKVLWLATTGQFVPYEFTKHGSDVRKFLFWQDEDGGLLFLSNHHFHRDLMRYCKRHAPERKPDGAGDCMDGYIQGWRSNDFEVETPQELRPAIREALGID